MITIKPENVVFENRSDVVDYVALGLAPTRKNFVKVMAAIDRDDEAVANDENLSRKVFIPDKVLNITDEDFKQVIHRVYEDRRRNRNMVLGAVGVVAVGVLGAALLGAFSSDDDKCMCRTKAIYDDDDITVYEY